MIYLFRIISDEDQEFYRDLVIDGTDTFLDFHQTLQDNLGYDPSQLASFFITNEMWEKQQEITLIDMLQDPGVSTITMEQATLDEYITKDTQRMIYVFDFFAERAFFIELLEKSDQTSPRNTPFIGHARGDAPPQLTVDLMMEDDPVIPTDEFDPDEEKDDLRLDDLDPDMFENGMPEDF